MSELDRIRAELVELQGVLGLFDDAEPDEWSAEWMGLQSLLARQAELLHQSDLLQGAFEFEITLTGEAVESGSVEMGFAGQLLSLVQGAVSSVVQVLEHGPQRRGRFPSDVLAASKLRLVATAPGSFVFGLEGPMRAAQDSFLESDPDVPTFDQAVERILDTFDAAESDIGSGQLTEAISRLGDHRAISKMVDLSKMLARSGTGARAIRRSRFLPGVRESNWSTASARRLSEALSRTEQHTSSITATGRLTGVRWRTSTFDLEIGEGDNLEMLSGHVTRDLRDDVRDAFDRVVTVTLERTVTSTPVEGEDTVSHRLIEIRAMSSG